MRTKSDYAAYLQTPHWKNLREEYLAAMPNCARCFLPRWLSELIYYQDLHLHHLSYANLGSEDWRELLPLCRRCHEIETFGRSALRAPKSFSCGLCRQAYWNKRDGYCPRCLWFLDRDIDINLKKSIFAVFPDVEKWLRARKDG